MGIKDIGNLVRTAKTTLGSKIFNKCHGKMIDITVDVIMFKADLENKDINFK